ncbi:MAG: hypothetical protein RL398_885 [Planctomycetota bacterium]
MADDKKKDAEAKPGKKKAVPAIVMVVVGAIAGGAGVVTMLPPKTVEVVKEPEQITYERIWVKEAIEHAFNPKGSKRLASFSFKYEFIVRTELKEQALELIRSKRYPAEDVSLALLQKRTPEELQREDTKAILKNDLIRELDRCIFGEIGKDPIARVTDIAINRNYCQ